MREQMAQRDRRLFAIGQRGLETRQVSRDRVAQPDPAEFDQAERRRGDERLGQRCKPEHRILAHRPRALAVRETRGLAIDDVAVLRDEHDCAHQALVRERAVDCGVDRLHAQPRFARQTMASLQRSWLVLLRQRTMLAPRALS
jgi:hypothetical protein